MQYDLKGNKRKTLEVSFIKHPLLDLIRFKGKWNGPCQYSFYSLFDWNVLTLVISSDPITVFKLCWTVLSVCGGGGSVAQSCLTPWTVARQAALSMEFSRQEYWSGLPFPPPGDLPDPGIKPGSPALQTDSLLTEPPGTYVRIDIPWSFIVS